MVGINDFRKQRYTKYVALYKVLLLTLVFLAALIQTLSAQFAGGDGTDETPFQVQTVAHLNLIRTNYLGAAHTDVYFEQIADITLEGNWAPIGTSTTVSFQGEYDGAGFEISNLRTTSAFYTGLFAYTAGSAVLRNMHIREMVLLGSHQNGGLVGSTANTNFIDCSVVGTVSANSNHMFGGMAGRATGTTNFTRCWTDVEISGVGYYAGGLVGSYESNADC